MTTSFTSPVWTAGPTYTIDQIILTDQLDATGRPVRTVDHFRPDQTIICWLSTLGNDGPVGIRWYYRTEHICECVGPTLGNQFYSYIQSSPTKTLSEGDYRVEIYTAPDRLAGVLPFRVEQYRPQVEPPPLPPVGHQDLEQAPYPTVAFAFDERWEVGGREWEMNEVKVLLLNEEEVYLGVTVKTSLNPGQMSERLARKLARPLAEYALSQGYLERARGLRIDGRQYPLDEVIVVSLVNREAGVIPGVGQVPVRRVEIKMGDGG